MVKDTDTVLLSINRAEVKSPHPIDVELYEQCFAIESPTRIAKLEPRMIFAKVIRQIETMELYPRPTTSRESAIARGYVFAIHETGSDFVTIGHGCRIALASTLRTLQLGNSRQLEIIAVLQRASFDDARALCGLITTGMTMYKTRGRAWYTMDDCCRKVIAMFAKIDKVVDSDRRDILPMLRR